MTSYKALRICTLLPNLSAIFPAYTRNKNSRKLICPYWVQKDNTLTSKDAFRVTYRVLYIALITGISSHFGIIIIILYNDELWYVNKICRSGTLNVFLVWLKRNFINSLIWKLSHQNLNNFLIPRFTQQDLIYKQQIVSIKKLFKMLSKPTNCLNSTGSGPLRA